MDIGVGGNMPAFSFVPTDALQLMVYDRRHLHRDEQLGTALVTLDRLACGRHVTEALPLLHGHGSDRGSPAGSLPDNCWCAVVTVWARVEPKDQPPASRGPQGGASAGVTLQLQPGEGFPGRRSILSLDSPEDASSPCSPACSPAGRWRPLSWAPPHRLGGPLQTPSPQAANFVSPPIAYHLAPVGLLSGLRHPRSTSPSVLANLAVTNFPGVGHRRPLKEFHTPLAASLPLPKGLPGRLPEGVPGRLPPPRPPTPADGARGAADPTRLPWRPPSNPDNPPTPPSGVLKPQAVLLEVWF